MNEDIDLNKDMEMQKALEEFQEKSSVEQAEETAVAEKEPDVPGMVKLVMKWSGVKEQRQAEYILLGFIVVVVAISLYLFFGGSKTNTSPLPEVMNGTSNS